MTLPKHIVAYILKGLPASGKSTWAKEVISQDPSVVRVNNDDIREELFGKNFEWSPELEKKVRQVRFSRLEEALYLGRDVIVDNTHLNARTLNSLIAWFHEKFPAVEVIIKDFTNVPMTTCIERDQVRKANGERFVGPEVICKMAKEAGLQDVIVPNVIDLVLPWAIVSDLDGTLALFGNRRNAYDASQCHIVDEPNLAVLNTLKTYHTSSETHPRIKKVFFFSGRTDLYKWQTEDFLRNKCGFDVGNNQFFQLVMRKEGDRRSDEVVKWEMYEAHIRGKYNVHCVFDDRLKVIRLWKSLGLPVFNVGNSIEF